MASDFVTIATVEESTWGTTPSANLQSFGYATSLPAGGWDRRRETPGHLRGDYVNLDSVRVGESGSLSIPFVLSYSAALQLWFEAIFRNDWSAVVSVSGTDISFSSVTSKISQVAAGFATTWANRWVRVVGSTSNDGYYFVTAAVAAELTVSASLGDGPLVTEAAGASITVDNDGTLVQGVALKSHTIERAWSDVTKQYIANTGMVANSLQLNVPKGPIAGTLGFIGKSFAVPAAASVGTGFDAENAVSVMDGTDRLTDVFVGGSAVAAKLTSIGLTLNSPVELKDQQLTETDPFGFVAGNFAWQASLGLYYDNNGEALVTAAKNNTATSLYFRIDDEEGNSFQFSFPALVYNSGSPDKGGSGRASFATLPLVVEYDSTTGILGQVDRFASS